MQCFHIHIKNKALPSNEYLLSINGAAQNERLIRKTDPELIVTKLKSICCKYTNNKAMKVTIGSEVYQTIYHNGS